MRTRSFAAAAFVAFLAPSALRAASTTTGHAPSARSVVFNAATAYTRDGDRDDQDFERRGHDDHGDYDDRGEKHCGRGNAWGCRRNRDDRYDDDRRSDRWDHERYERARYERDRYERDGYEREQYERARYERARYERERYERERYERDRYYERERYSPSRPIACVHYGNRVVGGVVVSVCLP